jgi:hypothetical protein
MTGAMGNLFATVRLEPEFERQKGSKRSRGNKRKEAKEKQRARVMLRGNG